jgi:FMNH2-dependent dimethyl sulfone monooxygenase
VVKSITDRRDFKLGLFSSNCSSGLAVTKVPDRWSGSWEDNLRLAKIADEVGIDFMLPIARWIGYGGETNFHEGVLDPIAWAAGLLAHTKRIFVFSTVHTAFNHPIVVAKQLATIDQIGQGRAGINIVAGWNKIYLLITTIVMHSPKSGGKLSRRSGPVLANLITMDGSTNSSTSKVFLSLSTAYYQY